MKTTLVRRLEKLEARSGTEELPFFRYGFLKKLPKEFSGERHVVTVTSEPQGSPRVLRCSFEERAGPEPAHCANNDFVVFLAERN